MNTPDTFEILMNKYVSGTCTREELKELLLYFTSESQMVDQILEKLWLAEMKISQDSEPSETQVNYILEEAKKLQGQLQERRQNRLPLFVKISKVAAIAIIGVITWMLLTKNFGDSTKDTPAPEFTERFTKSRQKDHFKLIDGSIVTLNSESRLSIKNSFGNTFREVNLKGEAYFRVAKDSLHPFLISTDQLQIKVVGTSFNVKSFDDDKEIIISVTSGKVMVSDRDSHKVYYLTVNKQLVYNKKEKTFRTRNVKAKEFSGWIDGKLIFNKTPFPEVARTLERWYGIRVVIQNQELLKYNVSGNHNNESLESVASTLMHTFQSGYYIKADTLFFTKLNKRKKN